MLYEPIKVLVTNPPNFDWPSFFFGGFMGSLFILGLEKLVDNITIKQKFQREKSQVTKALNTEIENNLIMSELVIQNLTTNSNIITFAKFEFNWLDIYSQKFINFENEGSLRLLSFLNGAKRKMIIIENMQSNAQMFNATSKALMSFGQILQTFNQEIIKNSQELKSILEAIKKNKIDNTIPNLNEVHPTTT